MLLDRIVQIFLPKQDTFFQQLDAIGRCAARGAACFARFADASPDQFETLAAELRSIEHEGDQLAHALYDELDKSFVTPIDREDLHDLTAAIDDVLDQMEECGGLIVIYRLAKVTPAMQAMIKLAHDGAVEVAACVALLADPKHHGELQRRFVRVHEIENQGDELYRTEIARLFRDGVDPIELIREKEVLDALEASIDACDDVCDRIRSVVVKNS